MPDEFLDRLSISEREAIWRNTLDAAGRELLVCRSEDELSASPRAALAATKTKMSHSSVSFMRSMSCPIFGVGDAAMLCGSVSRRRSLRQNSRVEHLGARRQCARPKVLRTRRVLFGSECKQRCSHWRRKAPRSPLVGNLQLDYPK